MTRQEQIKELSEALEYTADHECVEPIWKHARQHLKLLQDLESGNTKILNRVPTWPMVLAGAECLDIKPSMADLVYVKMFEAAPEYRFED